MPYATIRCVLFVIAVLVTGELSAADPFNPQEALVGASAEAVWTMLTSQPLMLTSEVHAQGFCVELIALQPDTAERHVIYDLQQGTWRSAGMISGSIGLLESGGKLLHLSDGKFVISDSEDADHLSHWPLNDRMMIESPESTIFWDRRSRCYVRNTQGAVSCRVSFRTPSDCERWNCGWQSVSSWRQGRCTSEMRRIVFGADREHRLRNVSSDWFEEWIEERAALPKLQQFESLLAKATYQDDVRRHSAWLGDRYILHGLTEMYAAADSTTGHEGEEEYEAPVRTTVAQFFDHVQMQIPVWMTRATVHPFTLQHVQYAPLSMDDPAMRYWRAALVVGPHQLTYLNEFLRKYVLRNQSLPLEIRLAACDTMGDLGSPATLFEPLALIEDRLLCEAVLFSRWQYPLEDRHVEACVDFLNLTEHNRLCDGVLVESLVRMDELDRVPPPALDVWWNQEAILKSSGVNPVRTNDPEASELDRRFPHADVWDTVCITSRTPSGRRFLIRRLGTKDPLLLRRAIHHCLRLRAESTLRTKRWDFMTEAECQQILALPAPPTSGKDTEGGAARPFPKDE